MTREYIFCMIVSVVITVQLQYSGSDDWISERHRKCTTAGAI